MTWYGLKLVVLNHSIWGLNYLLSMTLLGFQSSSHLKKTKQSPCYRLAGLDRYSKSNTWLRLLWGMKKLMRKLSRSSDSRFVFFRDLHIFTLSHQNCQKILFLTEKSPLKCRLKRKPDSLIQFTSYNNI